MLITITIKLTAKPLETRDYLNTYNYLIQKRSKMLYSEYLCKNFQIKNETFIISCFIYIASLPKFCVGLDRLLRLLIIEIKRKMLFQIQIFKTLSLY